jgi:hypothetical protein
MPLEGGIAQLTMVVAAFDPLQREIVVMKKVGLFVLLAVLVLPVLAHAVDYSIQVNEVSVMGCGPNTPVYFAGTTVYGADPDEKCTRLYDKPETQGFFLSITNATWCDRRTSWNFTKQYAPGDYVLRAYVTSSGNFNKANQDVTFHVAACPCP